MPQITNQHADSLSRIVKLMKLIIVKRNEPNAPLSLEYCDELLEALKPERNPSNENRT